MLRRRIEAAPPPPGRGPAARDHPGPPGPPPGRRDRRSGTPCRRARRRAGPSSLRCRSTSARCAARQVAGRTPGAARRAGTCRAARSSSSRSPVMSCSPITRRYVPSKLTVFSAAIFASPPIAFRTSPSTASDFSSLGAGTWAGGRRRRRSGRLRGLRRGRRAKPRPGARRGAATIAARKACVRVGLVGMGVRCRRRGPARAGAVSSGQVGRWPEVNCCRPDGAEWLTAR